MIICMIINMSLHILKLLFSFLLCDLVVVLGPVRSSNLCADLHLLSTYPALSGSCSGILLSSLLLIVFYSLAYCSFVCLFALICVLVFICLSVLICLFVNVSQSFLTARRCHGDITVDYVTDDRVFLWLATLVFSACLLPRSSPLAPVHPLHLVAFPVFALISFYQRTTASYLCILPSAPILDVAA